jgi:hypothetical protein
MDKFMKLFITTLLIASIALFSSISTANINKTPDGEITTYHDNGAKKVEKLYKNGIPIGNWKSWYEGGKPYADINFLNQTGHIESIQVFYTTGELFYLGETFKKGSADAKVNKNCFKGVSELKSEADERWYESYIMKSYRFNKDGSCVGALKSSVDELFANYATINDSTTGAIYDFPWLKTANKWNDKESLNCAADRITINSMMREMEPSNKKFLERINKEEVLLHFSILQHLEKLGSSNKEAEAIINNAIKESFDRHAKAIEDFGPYEKPSEAFEKVIFPKMKCRSNFINKSEE